MDLLNNLKGTINSVSKDVANKVSTSTSIAKLNSKIKENEQMSMQVKLELGGAVYEAWDGSQDSPFAGFLVKLKTLDEEKAAYQKEIEQIQEEIKRLQEEKERLQQEKIYAANAMICPECAMRNNEGAKFCIRCGKPLADVNQNFAPEQENQKRCHVCGNIVGDDELFCINCGTKIGDSQ